jgi:hypothetical protein
VTMARRRCGDAGALSRNLRDTTTETSHLRVRSAGAQMDQDTDDAERSTCDEEYRSENAVAHSPTSCRRNNSFICDRYAEYLRDTGSLFRRNRARHERWSWFSGEEILADAEAADELSTTKEVDLQAQYGSSIPRGLPSRVMSRHGVTRRGDDLRVSNRFEQLLVVRPDVDSICPPQVIKRHLSSQARCAERSRDDEDRCSRGHRPHDTKDQRRASILTAARQGQ